MRGIGVVCWGALALGGCGTSSAWFGNDVAFLEDHTDVVVLSDKSGDAQVVVCPALQGRVMTSTAEGRSGASFGWINYDLIAFGKAQPHFNAYGGEDRFWLGPEGGPYSIFFAPGAPFDLDHWFAPPPLDTEPFIVARREKDRIRLRKRMRLENAAGTRFDLEVRREVRVLEASEAWKRLNLPPVAGVRMVAFESENGITNRGREPWTKERGLLSIWILGMFKPTPATTVVIPLRPGKGPAVNDAYFGKVPEDRLAVRGGTAFFKGDGRHRGKIGISPRRSKPVFGSYDGFNKVLTLVQFTLPEGAEDYVNSRWGFQDRPYEGDAVNSYNDGPAAPGEKPFGPFYELESSSPAAALKPDQSLTHVHRTFHFRGPDPALEEVARRTLGVSLAEIASAFVK